jgi:predicted nucleotidyltransferase
LGATPARRCPVLAIARCTLHIDSGDTIADLPIFEVRDFLRHILNHTHAKLWVCASYLGVSERTARPIIAQLVEQGYLEVVSKRPKIWRTTLKGGALANAKAAKPIRRATAERVLREFMERVHEVNTNAHYLYKVTRVVLFGSYLSDKETLGDVDIALRMERKTEDFEEHQRLNRQRVKEAEARGRFFSWWREEDEWGEHETQLFLKSRSRSLSLHTWEIDRKMIETTTYQVLYEETPAETKTQPPAI